MGQTLWPTQLVLRRGGGNKKKEAVSISLLLEEAKVHFSELRTPGSKGRSMLLNSSATLLFIFFYSERLLISILMMSLVISTQIHQISLGTGVSNVLLANLTEF